MKHKNRVKKLQRRIDGYEVDNVAGNHPINGCKIHRPGSNKK